MCAVSISGPMQICPGGSGTLTATGGFVDYSWSNSDNGNPITITQSGTYTVTATDAGGCTATATYNVGLISVPAPQVGVPPILCSGGISVVAVTPNPSFVSYQWSNGGTNIANYVVTAGTYTVTVTTNQGCTTTASGTVNFSGNSIPNATYTISPSACSPPPVTLSTSSFPPAILVAWSDEDLTQILAISNSYVATQPGVYVAIRTYINACIDTIQIPVGNGIPPVPVISGPTTLCPGQTGVLSVQTGFSSYQWSGSATGNQPDLPINGPGTYTVVVRQGACTGTATRVVTSSGSANVSITSSPYQCNGQLTLNASPGFATYSWSTGDNSSSITVTQAGPYTVTVTTAGGCTGTRTFNATLPPAPMVTVTGPAQVCAGQNATLSASTGLSNYAWSSGQNGRVITINAPGTYTVTASDASGCTTSTAISVGSGVAPAVSISGPPSLCTGTNGMLSATPGMNQYQWNTGSSAADITIVGSGTFTVTVTNADGCTASATYTVSNLPAPVPSVQQAPYQCDGMLTLSVGGTFVGYTWNTGDTGSSISVNSSGTYTVTVTNAAGCTGTAQRNAVIPPPPVVAITAPIAFCAGSSATLRASPGFSSYQWSAGGSGANLVVTTANTYTVTVTNASGCSATAEHSILQNVADDVITSGPATLCAGATVSINASAGFTSYVWSNNAQGPTISVNAGGTYRVTATDGNGCTTTATHTVTSVAAPQPVIQTLPYTCNGNLTLQVSLPATTFVWSNGSSGTQITAAANGTYTVTATNSAGCTGTAVKTVSIPPPPAVNITGPMQVCSGQSAPLAATAGFTFYNWSQGSTTATIAAGIPGAYGVTVSDANNCTAAATFLLNVTAGPALSIGGNTSLCAGTATTLNATPGLTSYIWSGGQTGNTLSVTSAGSYTVTATNAAGCTASATTAVTVGSTLSPVIQALPYTCNSLLRLTVPGNFTSYAWSTGAVGSQITISASGTYSVTVTAGTCSGTGTIDAVIPPVPNIGVAGDDDLCPGQSSLLSASPGFSAYIWSTGATTSAITVNGPGLYKVTATDAFGCSTFAPVIVTQLPLPVATIQGNPAICPGKSVVLQGPPGMKAYRWSNSASTQQVEIFLPLKVELTVTDNNGCTNTAQINTLGVADPVPVLETVPYDCDGTLEIRTTQAFSAYQWSNAATTAVVSAGNSGTYSVMVTDANACTGTADLSVVVPVQPVASIAGPLRVCAGEAAPWQAAPGFVTYSWSSGETANGISVSNAGAYTVTVTDALGCTATATASLLVNALPDASISGKMLFCEGKTTTLSGPTGLSAYTWSTGATGAQIDIGTAGTVGLTVTDANGCISSNSINISAAPPVQPGISQAPYQCNGIQALSVNGAFTLYQWSNGAATAGIDASSSGLYTVTVTDAEGCTGTAEQTVTVPPAPVASIAGPLRVCAGEAAPWQAAPGFVTYSWSSGETTNGISVSNAGVYTVTVTDALGCTATATASLLVNALPDASIGGKPLFCEGKTTTLSGPAGLSAYTWSTGATSAQIDIGTAGPVGLTVTDANGCISSNSINISAATTVQPGISQAPYQCNGIQALSVNGAFTLYQWSNGAATAGIDASSSGLYTVTVTDAEGCTGTAEQSVTVPSAPVASIAGPLRVCAGEAAPWQAAPGFVTYSWSSGETTNGISVSNAGAYTVTVTDALGCTATATASLLINTLPDASIGGKPLFCEGKTTALSAPAGLSAYAWSTGATGAQIDIGAAGTVGLTVTDANGCISSNSINISAAPPVQPGITQASYQCNGIQALSVNGTFTLYQWSNGAVTAGIDANSSGLYTVTVTDAEGCTGTAEQSVTVPPAPVATITGPLRVCAGEAAPWQAAPGFVTYSWSNGETTNGISVSNAGSYTVTVADALGCTATATASLLINALPDASIGGKPLFCEGKTTTLSGPTGLSAYTWSNGATGAQIDIGAAGSVGLTVTDANGCISSNSINISAAPPVQPGITQAPYQCNGIQSLSVSGAFTLYQWSNGAATAGIDASSSGLYTVTVTDAEGCTGTAEQTVTVPPAPVASIAGPLRVCTGEAVQWQAAPGFVTYIWSSGETTNGISVSNAGTYTVTVTDALGCTATATASLLVNALPDASIGGKPLFCEGKTTALSAPAGLSAYAWSTGATGAQVNIGTAGSVGLTVTDANGCKSNSSIVVAAAPLVRPVIAQAAYQCNGIQSLSVSGAFTLYHWSNGATTTGINANSSGLYTVTVTNAEGCTGTAGAPVNIPLPPVAAISGPAKLCSGQQANLSAAPGLQAYLWSTGATTAGIAIQAGGTYLLTGTDAWGCTASAAWTVQQLDTIRKDITVQSCQPSAVGQTRTVFNAVNGCDSIVVVRTVLSLPPTAALLGDTLVCAGDTALLRLRLSSGTAQIRLLSSSGSAINIQQAADGALIPVVPAAGTQYTLQVRRADGCPVALSDSVAGVQISRPLARATTVPACATQFEGVLQLAIQGGTAPYRIAIGNEVFTAPDPLFQVNLPAGAYSAQVSDALGCRAAAVDANISDIYTALRLELGPDIVATLGAELTLRPQQINFPTTGIRWWAGDSLVCDRCPELQWQALRNVTLIAAAEHPGGCTVRDSLSLRVERIRFYLPNAIAPEGREENRYFEVPQQAGIAQVERLQLFDRWGNQVFAAANFAPGDERGRWDGSFNGKTTTPGVYVYWMKVRYLDGSVELISGDLTVLR